MRFSSVNDHGFRYFRKSRYHFVPLIRILPKDLWHSSTLLQFADIWMKFFHSYCTSYSVFAHPILWMYNLTYLRSPIKDLLMFALNLAKAVNSRV